MPVRNNATPPSLQNDPKLTPTGEDYSKKLFQPGRFMKLQMARRSAGSYWHAEGDTRGHGRGPWEGYNPLSLDGGEVVSVLTSAGYCTSAPPDHADGICKPYRKKSAVHSEAIPALSSELPLGRAKRPDT